MVDISKIVKTFSDVAEAGIKALDDASSRLPQPAELNNSKLMPTDITPNSVFMQNDLWKYDIVFDNKSVKPFVLPAHQIESFSIKHNILDPVYLSGTITIKSRRIGDINLITNDYSQEYIFRGDGEDVLTFKVNPSYDDAEYTLPKDIWFMDLVFRIYEVSDVPSGDYHYKVINFYHEPIHILRNTAATFSTSDYVYDLETDKPTYLMSNEERKIFTGEALYQIYKNAGLDSYTDKKNWDKGSSKIFYSSGSNVVHQQDVEYILKRHTSEDGDHKCILYYNRGEKKLQLLSLMHFFDRAMNGSEPGEYQLDHLWINPTNSGYEDVDLASKLNKKAPIKDQFTLDTDIKIRSHNILSESNFKLSEMNGDTSMGYLVTTPVHTYDHGNKKFKCFLKDNDIVKTKDHFRINFSEKVFPAASGKPLLTLNNFKTENISSRHVYQPYENISEKTFYNFGRNFIVQNAVFSNLAIEMKLPGSTHRQAGRFVAIEKNEYNDTKYHYKLLGQWFVAESVLAWENGDLVNYVTAVKINSHMDLKLEEKT